MKPGFTYLVKNFFSTVSERGVPKVVPKGNGFGKIFVQAQASRNTSGGADHFKSVGQASAKMIIGRRKKNLSFMLKPSERFAVNNSVYISLKIGANKTGIFLSFAASTVF
jgi:hypothetical protein